VLEEVQAQLTQAEQEARAAEWLAAALKEKSDALTVAEDQLQQERAVHEEAQT
jgi:hypothetical protein